MDESLTGMLSTLKTAEVMVALASGLKVAARSNRWPAKKRAMIGGVASPKVNKALGGVSRETLGAAVAIPVVNKTVERASPQKMRVTVGFIRLGF